MLFRSSGGASGGFQFPAGGRGCFVYCSVAPFRCGAGWWFFVAFLRQCITENVHALTVYPAGGGDGWVCWFVTMFACGAGAFWGHQPKSPSHSRTPQERLASAEILHQQNGALPPWGKAPLPIIDEYPCPCSADVTCRRCRWRGSAGRSAPPGWRSPAWRAGRRRPPAPPCGASPR